MNDQERFNNLDARLDTSQTFEVVGEAAPGNGEDIPPAMYPPGIYPPPLTPPTQPGAMLKPHRGGLILGLGVASIPLTFLLCGPVNIVTLGLSIPALLMARADLRAMDAGFMDPMGRANTSAGKVCGIIAIVLVCIGLVIFAVSMIFNIAAFGMAGSGAGP